MSKNMIDRVHGTIEAFSILNKKTTFVVRLPDEGAEPSSLVVRTEYEEEDIEEE
jgi:hypothetical protein